MSPSISIIEKESHFRGSPFIQHFDTTHIFQFYVCGDHAIYLFFPFFGEHAGRKPGREEGLSASIQNFLDFFSITAIKEAVDKMAL